DGGRRRRRKRGPEAQNRHGGAPRGERPASWDARRLARRLTCRVMACPTGAAAPERFSALRPPPDSGWAKQSCKTRTQTCAAGTRWAVWHREMEITENGSATSRELGRPHPEERACGKAAADPSARARVSKDEDGPHASRRRTARGSSA